MKKYAIFAVAVYLVLLCACLKQPVQELLTLPEQSAQERQDAAAVRFASQQVLRYYLKNHTALSGNLPAFCEATENGTPEKFQAGAEILKNGREQFSAYLFAHLDRLPEEAFADDAAWMLSDTPRGNLLLEGPEVKLVYNAEEDDVHPPRKAEVDKDTLATLKVRYEQACVAPGFDRDSFEGKAFLGYLQEEPDSFQDDGVSVFEDTAWLIRYGDDDIAQLCFLRENPFCGLSVCALAATPDGYVSRKAYACLDSGWFLDASGEDELTARLVMTGCKETEAAQIAHWLWEQSAQFMPSTEAYFAERPGMWEMLADVKNAVWLTEETPEGGKRILFFIPGDDRYQRVDPDASTIVVRQIFITADGNIQQSPGSVLQTEVNKNPINRESAVRLHHDAQLSLFQSVWDVNPDVWQGFDVAAPCEDSDEIVYSSSWRSYSNGDLMICIPHEQDVGLQHIHLLTDRSNWFGMCPGMTMEQFWKTLDLAGVSHTKYPEQSKCLCSGFTLHYQQKDDILTELWLSGHA